MILNLNRIRTSTLFFLGAAALAVRSGLQVVLDRSGHATNTTDFALGVMFGIGLGLLMIVAWRSGRKTGRA